MEINRIKPKYLLFALICIIIFACKKKQSTNHYIWHDEVIFSQLTPFLESASEHLLRQDSLEMGMSSSEIVVIDTSAADTLSIYGWEGRSIFNQKDSIWYERPMDMYVYHAFALPAHRGYAITYYTSYELISDSSNSVLESNVPKDILGLFMSVADSVQSTRIAYFYAKNKEKWEMYRKGAYFPGR